MNNLQNFINILSMLLSPIIAVCTGLFMWQQKEIQKKQQRMELFKLRIEHIKNLFDYWGEYNKYIDYIPHYKAEIVATKGEQEEIISTFRYTYGKLYKHNMSTTVLFNKELCILEDDFIQAVLAIIPQNSHSWSIYNILEDYEICKDKFNALYNEYEEILNKECKINK